MSAAIDRLRADCARRQGALPETHDADVAEVLALIDDLRRENDRVAQEARDISAHDRGLMGEQITRADAAEADRDYWRAQATMAAPCVDAVRAIGSRLIPGGTGCAVDPERVVAAVEGLCAVVAGRDGASLTPEAIAAHALAHPIVARRSANGWEPECAYSLWLAQYDTDRRPVPRTDALLLGEDGHWSEDFGACGPPSIVWALSLDATGRPCPGPTALDAGEGR